MKCKISPVINMIFSLMVCCMLCIFIQHTKASADDYSSVMPDANTATSEPVVITEPALNDTSAVTNEALSLSKKSITIGIGQEYALNIDKTAEDVIWSSDDSDIAEVSDKGLVRGLKKGKMVITAEIGKTVLSCTVKVKNTGLLYTGYTMNKGEKLKVHLLEKETGNIRWKSSNKKVATVKKGVVTAVKKGNAVIRATVANKTYSMKIAVKKGKLSIIYLTFDDGPSLTSTPRILKILKKNGVLATFFTINYDKTGERLIKQEAKEGHTVAIHGYSHDYKAIYSSETAYMNNIMKLQNKIYKSTGQKTWITRFPGGSSNLVSRRYSRGIMSRLVKKVEKAGFSYFDWNVGSGDAGDVHTSAQVYRNVISGLKKNRGNVVLMHDFSNNTKTINALERIIKYGKSHGYEFRAITESTLPVHHGVQN